MRLPLLAFAFAKRTHAPGAIGLFENGIVRDQPVAETLMTMSDTPNIPGALWSTGTLEIMPLLQQGLVDLGFIGGAETRQPQHQLRRRLARAGDRAGEIGDNIDHARRRHHVPGRPEFR